MKILIILLAVCLSFTGYGQQNGQSLPITQWKPLFYLDSVNVEFAQLHFDAGKVLDIHVDNGYYDSARQIHGRVFIKSKDPKSFYFLTIPAIAKMYNKSAKSPTLFMLDDEFLKDIDNIKIDSSYILKVELTKTADIDYLKKTVPGLTILKIITKTQENLDKQNRIIIRGSEPTALH